MRPQNLIENSFIPFSFNGMEKDNEVKGEGNSYDFGARMLDSRVGRFLSIDHCRNKFVYQSSFVVSGNRVLQAKDINGDSIYYVYTVKINDVPVQKIINASEVKDLYYMTGMELLYSTDIGKGEIDNYLTNKDYDIYIAKTYNSINNGKVAAVTNPSRSPESLEDGFCTDNMSEEYKEHFMVFEGIKGRNDVKESFFIVVEEKPLKETSDFDLKQNYISERAKLIFHEIRAHVTYSIQGIPLSKQHEHYGVQDGASGTDLNSDKSKDISIVWIQIRNKLLENTSKKENTETNEK
jgi:hypothetical protein